jgi:histidinol-phosphate aminotransferase
MIAACDLAPDHIKAIAAYQPGKPTSELARELNIDEKSIVKLASNENPLGASPAAIKAIERVLSGIALYPDGSGYDLKSALIKKHAVAREQIVLGNGSNDVLELAAHTFLTPNDSAVFSQYAFAVYPLAVQAIGAKKIEVPAKHYGHDLPAMANAIRDDTRIVFVANPNNPTGTFASAETLLAFIKAIPERVIIVLDEAYTEYLPSSLKVDTVTWLKQFPNLVITRTLSKAYGLAGLRVGFAFAHPDVADLMNRVRQPFNVNSLALAAAEAALTDAAFLEKSAQLNSQGLTQLTEAFDRLGLPYIPSYGNFVAVEVGDGAAIFQFLLKQGVIIRPIGGYGMPRHLRVSVGLPRENERFLAALADGLKQLAIHR